MQSVTEVPIVDLLESMKDRLGPQAARQVEALPDEAATAQVARAGAIGRFRDGETAYLYARPSRLLRQMLHVPAFAAGPYRGGLHNAEAIESGPLGSTAGLKSKAQPREHVGIDIAASVSQTGIEPGCRSNRAHLPHCRGKLGLGTAASKEPNKPANRSRRSIKPPIILPAGPAADPGPTASINTPLGSV
jgi:hypothetical protein